MLKKIILSLIIGGTSISGIIAQESIDKCGWYEAQELFIDGDESLREAIKENETEFNEFVNDLTFASKMTPDTIIIPIVFHVVHNYGNENVSNEHIYQALERLNTDMMAQNDDLVSVAEEFTDVIGNPQIEFRLAQYDPDGNCTSGITRTASPLTYIGDDEVKDLVMWPRNKYCNVWITKVALNGNAGGYTYKPGSVHQSPGIDGIIVRAAQFGPNERTLTHEIGHWLNLSHTWGDTNQPGLSSNCDYSDFVSDTPNTIGNSNSCNLSATSCGSLDNIQNYMDYGSCERMFTEGQANRMIAACNSYLSQRNQLWTESNLEATGVLEDAILCAADFEANKQRICSGTLVTFTNMSYNGDSEWLWEFEGGDPATSTEENPVVFYDVPGNYEVKLTIGNGVDEVFEIKDSFIHVLPDVGNNTPISEGFENVESLPNDDWIINSTDTDRYFEVTDVASATGSNSVVLKNYYQDDGSKDELESNPIDLSDLTDVVITFKYAYAKRTSSSDDILKLKITKNCGNIWISKETLKASNNTLVTANNHSSYFIPENDEWQEAYVDNISSLYLIENFRMKFEFYSEGGNNVFIDDINIFDPSTVGINEVNKVALKFTAYPNPLDDQLTVSFNLLHGTQVSAEVFDISGRKIESLFDQNYNLGTNTQTFNTSDWNPGVYMIRLNLEGETFIEKVIKQ